MGESPDEYSAEELEAIKSFIQSEVMGVVQQEDKRSRSRRGSKGSKSSRKSSRRGSRNASALEVDNLNIQEEEIKVPDIQVDFI